MVNLSIDVLIVSKPKSNLEKFIKDYKGRIKVDFKIVDYKSDVDALIEAAHKIKVSTSFRIT